MKIKHIITALTLAFSLSINITAQSPATGTINGHEYVDLGLSVKWATCNIGASLPSDYGDYFAWGEAETKSEYTKDNSATYGKISYTFLDAASAHWGSAWRMPTEAEYQELIDSCTWTWITVGGHKGCKVTSEKNGNSIFLPAAGGRVDTQVDTHIDPNYVIGSYWSSSPTDTGMSFIDAINHCDESAYNLEFHSDRIYVGKGTRRFGLTIRPVSDKTE